MLYNNGLKLLLISRNSCSVGLLKSANYSISNNVIIKDKVFKNIPSLGGSLWVTTPTHVDVSSLGPHEYPNMDKTTLKLLCTHPNTNYIKTHFKMEETDFGGGGGRGGGGGESASSSSSSLSATSSTSTSSKMTLRGDSHLEKKEDEISLTAKIQTPIVHNLNIDTSSGSGSITVSDFVESDYCHLKAHEGDIVANKIKSKLLNFQSGGGDIWCNGLIQGSIKINAEGNGNVVADKRFAGPSLDITTQNGDIRIAASYSEEAKFVTNCGSMHLRNIHNESYIAIYQQGDLKIQGLDGSTNIFVKKGDIDCQFSMIKHESRIHSEEGDIHLKISDNFPLKISIDANEIIPDIKFKEHGTISRQDESYAKYYATIHPNQFSPTLIVIAENGRVILESQDWAASLGLKLDPLKDISVLG